MSAAAECRPAADGPASIFIIILSVRVKTFSLPVIGDCVRACVRSSVDTVSEADAAWSDV